MEGTTADVMTVKERLFKKMDLADGVLKSAEYHSTKTLTREVES
jgi:hypothetical protein